jgi:hypothetical protein
MWRLVKVVESTTRFRHVTVRVKDVLYPFLGLLMANIIILTCWTIINPLVLRHQTNYSSFFHRPFYEMKKLLPVASTRQQPMRNRNKPARFRKSKEHDAAVGKCSKDASPGRGKHSKIAAVEKPVQLGNVHNAEDMDNLDPSLLFHDEDDYNKLQAMKEVDRELILSRCFEQLKMIWDMNVALKAAEDKEKEKAAEIKEKEMATDNNEEEVSMESDTAGAGDESKKKPHSVVIVM